MNKNNFRDSYCSMLYAQSLMPDAQSSMLDAQRSMLGTKAYSHLRCLSHRFYYGQVSRLQDFKSFLRVRTR